jgi:DNA-binding transcriptional LysR family regulator
MDIQQLKGFVAVATEKSFSRAAKKVYRTQSAVSLQVKALEDDLGTRLFDRIGRKTELTKDGSLLLELASPLIQDFGMLRKQFDERKCGSDKGELRITAHEPVIAYLLPRPIQVFKKNYPGVRIAILRKKKDEILNAILNGEADLGISSLKKIPSSIEYQVIARYPRVIIAPKDCPLAKKKTVTMKDIAGYALLLPPAGGSITRESVDRAFSLNGLDYALALETSGRQAVKSYIELGFGISVLNSSDITEEDRKKFFIADVSRFFGFSERGLLRRKSKHLPKFALDFIDLLFATAR